MRAIKRPILAGKVGQSLPRHISEKLPFLTDFEGGISSFVCLLVAPTGGQCWMGWDRLAGMLKAGQAAGHKPSNKSPQALVV